MEKELDQDWSKLAEKLARSHIELAGAMCAGNNYGREVMLKQRWNNEYPELERALGEQRAREMVKIYVNQIQQVNEILREESEGVRRGQDLAIGESAPPEEIETTEPEDTTEKIIKAFRKMTPATPLGKLRELIENIGAGWESDDETPEKAYALACFSELAYLHLAAYELQDRDRYKIFPSSTLRDLIASGTKIDLKQVVSAIAEDIKIQSVERPHFVYQLFDAPRFVAILSAEAHQPGRIGE